MKTKAEVYVWYGREKMSHHSSNGTPEEWYADLVEDMKTNPHITRVALIVSRVIVCRKLCKYVLRTANPTVKGRTGNGGNE